MSGCGGGVGLGVRVDLVLGQVPPGLAVSLFLFLGPLALPRPEFELLGVGG